MELKQNLRCSPQGWLPLCGIVGKNYNHQRISITEGWLGIQCYTKNTVLTGGVNNLPENSCSRELKTAEFKFFCVAMGYVMTWGSNIRPWLGKESVPPIQAWDQLTKCRRRSWLIQTWLWWNKDYNLYMNVNVTPSWGHTGVKAGLGGLCVQNDPWRW